MSIDITKSYEDLSYEEMNELETQFMTPANWGPDTNIFAAAREEGVDYIYDDEPNVMIALENLYKIESQRREFYANWQDYYAE